MTPYYQDDAVTIYHGDCRDVLPVHSDMVLTDIPYNISQDHGGLREIDYGDWDRGFDHRWVLGSIGTVPTIYLWCGKTQLSDLINEMHNARRTSRALVWVKPNPNIMNGQHFWIEATELCAFGRLSGATFNESCSPGVFYYSPPRERRHPTQKPEELMARCIAASSNRGGTVLDPFMGSGTTLRAAKDLNRKAIGIEIEEKYCEIAARRMEQEVLAL